MKADRAAVFVHVQLKWFLIGREMKVRNRKKKKKHTKNHHILPYCASDKGIQPKQTLLKCLPLTTPLNTVTPTYDHEAYCKLWNVRKWKRINEYVYRCLYHSQTVSLKQALPFQPFNKFCPVIWPLRWSLPYCSMKLSKLASLTTAP